MKRILSLCFIVSVLISCNKKDTEPEPDIEFEPTIFLEEMTLYQGDTAVIKGENMGTDPSRFSVFIGQERCSIEFVSEDRITFIVPTILERFEQNRTVKIYFHVNNTSDSFYDANCTILVNKSKEGWHYISEVSFVSDYLLEWCSFGVTPDTAIWLCNADGISHSLDGGWTWLIKGTGGVGKAGFLDKKTAWLYQTNIGWDYTTDGQNYHRSQNDPFGKDGAMDLWLETPTSGLALTYQTGLWRVESMEDFTPVYANGKKFRCLSVINRNNYAFISDRNLVYQSSGSLPEIYDMSSYAQNIYSFLQLQLLDGQTIYIGTDEKKIYRVTWPFQVTTLRQKADVFLFVNAREGYAIYNNVIYKTIDGAKSWEEDFVIDDEFVPIYIRENAGYIYVLLKRKERAAGGVLLRYIPKK